MWVWSKQAGEVRASPILFLLRLPRRLLRRLANFLATSYWRLFLKECGRDVKIEWGVYFDMPWHVQLGDQVTIGKGTVFGAEGNGAKVVIADRVQINSNCLIDHTGRLELGEDCLLSTGVKLYTHDHGLNPRSNAMPSDLRIGRNVWLGIESIVMSTASSISNDVVVGARSIVTKDLRDQAGVYVGMPARRYAPQEERPVNSLAP